jgi:hypothetical protein
MGNVPPLNLNNNVSPDLKMKAALHSVDCQGALVSVSRQSTVGTLGTTQATIELTYIVFQCGIDACETNFQVWNILHNNGTLSQQVAGHRTFLTATATPNTYYEYRYDYYRFNWNKR